MRIGLGYDVHALIAGRKLVLGGVTIPYERGLQGHSDADVICHAIGDALLGAAALGDLGTHFPDQDARYQGISSLRLLQEVAGMLAQSGFQILNVDATLVAERPRILSHVPRMRQLMAESLGIPVDIISVKATTTEGLGFTGCGQGMAAYAVALIKEGS